MYNNILRTKEKTSITEINKIETRFNFKMPNSIITHYLNYNGGCPEKDKFIDNEENEYRLTCFIPITGERENDLYETLFLLRDDLTIPQWLIPIGDDMGGDIFCYSLKEEELGSIYFWSHESGDAKYLTSSLKDFIDNMIEADESEDW